MQSLPQGQQDGGGGGGVPTQYIFQTQGGGAAAVVTEQGGAVDGASYPVYGFPLVYQMTNINGTPQAVLVHAPKDGAYYQAMLQNQIKQNEMEQQQQQALQEQQAAAAQRPIFVNPKQYERIMARRKARARMEAQRRILAERKPFLHKSRHDHACRRPRGPGGRFLTKEEIQAMKLKEEETGGGGGGDAAAEGEGGSGGGGGGGIEAESGPPSAAATLPIPPRPIEEETRMVMDRRPTQIPSPSLPTVSRASSGLPTPPSPPAARPTSNTCASAASSSSSAAAAAPPRQGREREEEEEEEEEAPSSFAGDRTAAVTLPRVRPVNEEDSGCNTQGANCQEDDEESVSKLIKSGR